MLLAFDIFWEKKKFSDDLIYSRFRAGENRHLQITCREASKFM